MPISSRVVINLTIVLLTIGLLALVGIVSTTVWLGEKAQIYVEDATRARNARIAAVELRAALQAAESSQRGYLVGGNEIYLAPYDSARTQAATLLEQLTASISAFPSTARLLERLSQLVGEKIDDLDRTIASKRELRDVDTLAVFGSNRGKALMDEANVFSSSIIRTTDERLTSGLAQQRLNATWLRLVSIVGGMVIIGVVGEVVLTIYRYTREVAQTRDQVQSLNATLEQRVRDRTVDIWSRRVTRPKSCWPRSTIGSRTV